MQYLLLLQLVRLATEQMQALGIPVSDRITEVTINRRAVRRLGCCHKNKDGSFWIEVSERVIQGDRHAVLEILCHELLHTCPGCLNHGAQFTRYAQKLNQAYGYHISRTADTTVLETIPDPKPARYLVRCKACGKEWQRYRRTGPAAYPEHYRCPCCRGNLEVIDRGKGEENG